jgi:hypothetical protein
MKTLGTVLLAGMLLGLGAVSCGDDETGGVSNNTEITDLSEEEAYELCMEFCSDVQAPAQELGCTVAAVSVSMGLPNACEKALDTCMAQALSCENSCSMEDESTDEGADDTEGMPECDATVGEASACFNAFAALIEDVNGQLSCSTKAADLQSILAPLEETPAECEALQAKCPEMVPNPDASEM